MLRTQHMQTNLKQTMSSNNIRFSGDDDIPEGADCAAQRSVHEHGTAIADCGCKKQ